MKKAFFASIVTIIFLSSCALHRGDMTDSASLQSNNFELIKLASGQASNAYYFGIGGLNNSNPALLAKLDMYKKNPLKRGQAFANLTVDREVQTVLFYTRVTHTISADIVQFDMEPEAVEGEHELFTTLAFNGTKINSSYYANDDLSINDSVVVKLNKSTIIFATVNSIDGHKVTISMNKDDFSNEGKKMTVTNNKVFKSTRPEKANPNQIHVGDEISFEYGGFKRIGKVMGVNDKELLINSEKYYFEISPLSAKLL
jgi:hypothetical protein